MTRRRKINKTGRGSNALSDFIPIERYIMRSTAFRSLKPTARAAYLEVCFCCDGSNNGRIQMSARILAERLGVEKSTAARALKNLIEHGFIQVTRQSAFSVKTKMCSEYRLTAFLCNVTGDLPSKEFMRWQPEIQNTVAPVPPHSGTCETEGTKATRNSSLQLRSRHCEGAKPFAYGGTGKTLLYSTILPRNLRGQSHAP
jgi:Helix-turn-helix domain